MTWPRPVPLIGDRTSAAERGAAPDGWRFPDGARDALHDVVRARRDVRRFRPDPIPEGVLERVLSAAHAAPSVGHSQPWRFLVVEDKEVSAERSEIVRFMRGQGYEVCAQNVIILDKINEYFFVDRTR